MDIFKGYFDDSGHEDDPNALCCSLAGYVSTVDNWKYFDTEWTKVLNDNDVPYLHMKEISCFRGPFKKYENNPTGRDFLLESLIKIIRDSNIIGFTSTIYLDKLKEINKLSNKRNRFIAYAINMYSCLWCISNKWPDTIIELEFDNTEKFNTKKIKAEVYAKRNKHYYKRYEYINANKINKKLSSKDIPALQASDLLAYEIAKEGKTKIELTKNICPRKVFTKNNINYCRRRKSMLSILENTKLNNDFQWHDIIRLAFLMKAGGYLAIGEDNEIKIELPH